MSTKSPSNHGSGFFHHLLNARPDTVPGYAERRASDPKRGDAPALGGGSLGEVRDSVIREHLADSTLAGSIFALVAAAHNVNRWDLTDSAIDALCDAARQYVTAYERVLAERGRKP